MQGESKQKWCIDEDRDVVTSCFLKKKWRKVESMQGFNLTQLND
jgi:hypothetical protein